MNPETIKALQDALTPLADKIGQGASHLYAVYARQIFAEGVVQLALAPLFLILTALCVWQFLKVFLHLDQYQSDEYKYISALKGDAVARLWVFGGAAATTLIFGLGFAFDGATKVINPEYAAIQRIIETVRGTAK